MELTKSCTLIKHNNLSTFNEHQQKAIKKSRLALQTAYSPYSNFKVGAAVLFEDGTISIGNNQENPAYPSGLCAERVALFHAMAINADKKITMIAISTLNHKNEVHPFGPPCGACLQVMADVETRQGGPIDIVLCGVSSYLVAKGVEQFLPFKFEL